MDDPVALLQTIAGQPGAAAPTGQGGVGGAPQTAPIGTGIVDAIYGGFQYPDAEGQEPNVFVDAVQDYLGKVGAIGEKAGGRQDELWNDWREFSDYYFDKFENQPWLDIKLPGNMGGGTISTPPRQAGNYFAQQAGVQGMGLEGAGAVNMNDFNMQNQVANAGLLPTQLAYDLAKLDRAGTWDLTRQNNQYDLTKMLNDDKSIWGSLLPALGYVGGQIDWGDIFKSGSGGGVDLGGILGGIGSGIGGIFKNIGGGIGSGIGSILGGLGLG
jgi:hypothetical protein